MTFRLTRSNPAKAMLQKILGNFFTPDHPHQ